MFRHSIAALAILTSLSFEASPLRADWPQFRGADGASLAVGARLPLTWGNLEGDANIAWRRALPGRGPSSPIVAAGRVLVTCSSGIHQDRLHVVSFDPVSGDLQWERQFWATGRTLTHPTSANAAPTPASDGKAVYALFSSNDLICLDLEGNLRWCRGLGYDYPQAGNDTGMASSPIVVGDTVIVQLESQDDSFAAGIDAATGETRWRLERPSEASWSSPVVLRKEIAGRDVALLQSPGGLTAVDAHRGDVLWRHDANCSGISSPVTDGSRIFAPAEGMTSLSLAGDSVETHWTSARLRPGAGSAVAHDGRLYMVTNAGVLACGDANTGEVLWQMRLEGRCWTTPIITGDKLYAINSDGKAFVVQLGDEPKIIGRSSFGEAIQGSPAVADDALYVRSDRYLWKIAETKSKP